MKNKRTLISGIISAVMLIAALFLFFLYLYAVFTKKDAFKFNLAKDICLLIAFAAAVSGMIKPQDTTAGKVFCVSGIVFPVLSFSIYAAVLIYAHISQGYTDKYLFTEKHKKIEYTKNSGFFDYNTEDVYHGYGHEASGGKFYFDVYDGGTGENNPFPYCSWLFFNKQNQMIGLDRFCSFYGIPYETDKKSRKTVITNSETGKKYNLFWGKYEAAADGSDEKIQLEYPVVYTKSNDTDDSFDTFVDLKFLYEAKLLNFSHKKTSNRKAAVEKYFSYMKSKASEIYENSEENADGIRNYRGNQIYGAEATFLNNELLDNDCVLKIGDTKQKAVSLFGIYENFQKNASENELDYSSVEIYYDDKEIINRIIIWCDSSDNFLD